MYDSSLIWTLDFPTQDFGASDVTQVIAMPTYGGISTTTAGTAIGHRVLGVLIYDVTENFAGSTSDAGVRVGDGSDDDLYFDSGLVLDETVDTTESLWLADDGAGVRIPNGTANVTVTFVASVGTPTGIASVKIFFLAEQMPNSGSS